MPNSKVGTLRWKRRHEGGWFYGTTRVTHGHLPGRNRREKRRLMTRAQRMELRRA